MFVGSQSQTYSYVWVSYDRCQCMLFLFCQNLPRSVVSSSSNANARDQNMFHHSNGPLQHWIWRDQSLYCLKSTYWRIYSLAAYMEVTDTGGLRGGGLHCFQLCKWKHHTCIFISPSGSKMSKRSLVKSVGPNCKLYLKPGFHNQSAILNYLSFSAGNLFKCNFIYNKLIGHFIRYGT